MHYTNATLFRYTFSASVILASDLGVFRHVDIVETSIKAWIHPTLNQQLRLVLVLE